VQAEVAAPKGEGGRQNPPNELEFGTKLTARNGLPAAVKPGADG